MPSHLSQKLSPAPPPGESNDLARLLETEARLEELLRGAGEEATRLVAAAREAAAARETALAAEVEADAHSLGETLHADYERRAAEAAAAAGRAAERLDQVGDEQIAVLARQVVNRVIGTVP